MSRTSRGFPDTPRRLEDGWPITRPSTAETVSAKATDVDHLDTPPPLSKDQAGHEAHGPAKAIPPKRGPRWYRFLRWNFGSVYRRIFCLSFAGNLTALVILAARSLLGGSAFTYQEASTAVTANMLAALVVRNEHAVNALFVLFVNQWMGTALPLSVRRLLAKVYSYGGVHSGASVAATFWYAAFLLLLIADQQSASAASFTALSAAILLVALAILFLLVSMLASAHPTLRVRWHNAFERVHRFMGWSAVLLFWVQTVLLGAEAAGGGGGVTLGRALGTNPSFWMLLVITGLVVYPWTRLRLRRVETEVLSAHCVKLNFDYADVQYGQAVRLADRPLRETHAFAVIPNPPALPRRSSDSSESLTAAGGPAGALLPAGRKGFSMLVSNAGDWTSGLIRDRPTHIYTRGAPQYGVLRVAGLFRPCLVMATGSGIGPCLSLFVQRPDHPVRIIWSAKRPAQTYGRAVLDVIYRADSDAVVIDTDREGRPDLVAVAWRVWSGAKSRGQTQAPEMEKKRKEGKKVVGPCEAVVIISNQKVTRKVVYGLESRGVPAYGAIFDS